MRRPAAATCLVLLLGCNLATFGTGAMEDASAPQDGAPPVDAGPRDALVRDAPSMDAPSMDANEAAPPPTFCQMQTGADLVACWDFEGPLDASSLGFDEADPEPGGTLSVVVDGPNHVLESKLPTGAGSKAQWVRRAVPIPGSGNAGYVLDFRFQIPTCARQYAVLGGLSFFFGAPSAAISDAVTEYSAGTVLDHAASALAPSVATMPGATWHTASVRVTGDTTSARQQLTIDGTQVHDVTAYPGAGISGFDVRLGSWYTSGESGSVDVRFDDVVLRRL